ncbi:hypothetical protein [Microbispora triticiradicis]|uniref:hypothetical protein n=1 Tax=Microbispora triticiradicis TaxID=2200763 RepID=UPI001AD74A7B|nr:hypothetical protein [Microbispora triticiradicis]
MLAPEVVLVSDGRGLKQAAPRPITGAGRVARFIIGGIRKAQITLTSDPTVVKGKPALLLHADGELDGVTADPGRGRPHHRPVLRRNPQKLTRVASETPLTLR